MISYTSVYRAAQLEVEVQPTLQPQPTTPQVVVLPVQQHLWRATIVQPHQQIDTDDQKSNNNLEQHDISTKIIIHNNNNNSMDPPPTCQYYTYQ